MVKNRKEGFVFLSFLRKNLRKVLFEKAKVLTELERVFTQ